MRGEYVASAVRFILVVKFLATAPVYAVRMYDPGLLPSVPWCVSIDAFHNFEATVFYTLALYRASLQLYFSIHSNKKAFRHFLALEALSEGIMLAIFCIEYHYHGLASLSNSAFFTLHLTATAGMAFLHHQNSTHYSAEKHVI